MIRLIITLLLLSGCASHYGQDWSSADTARQAAYTVLHVQDWRQTLEISRNPDQYSETNFILGRHPSESEVNSYMAGTLLLNSLIAPALKPKYRRWFQYIGIGVEGACVVNNLSIGLHGGF